MPAASRGLVEGGSAALVKPSGSRTSIIIERPIGVARVMVSLPCCRCTDRAADRVQLCDERRLESITNLLLRLFGDGWDILLLDFALDDDAGTHEQDVDGSLGIFALLFV